MTTVKLKSETGGCLGSPVVFFVVCFFCFVWPVDHNTGGCGETCLADSDTGNMRLLRPWLAISFLLWAAAERIPLHLGGLFAHSGTVWPIGVQMEAAARLALRDLKSPPYQHILPKHDLRIIYRDDRCETSTAIKGYVDHFYISTKASSKQCPGLNETAAQIPIVGLLGPSCSGGCAAVSQTVQNFYHFTLSATCTSGTLSNADAYQRGRHLPYQ